MSSDEGSVPVPSAAKPRGWTISRRNVVLALVVAAVLVAAIVFLPLTLGVWSPLVHFECGAGSVVPTARLWTPAILVNSPHGGFANGTGKYPTPTGWWGEGVGAVNGSATAPFDLDNWSIARSIRVPVPGPGANADCPDFVATGYEVMGYTSAVDLLPNGTRTDAAEVSSLSLSDAYGNTYGSVIFDNGYSERDFSFTSCAGGPVGMAVRATEIAVEVPFTVDGVTHLAAGTIHGEFNWTYSFPGHFGTWLVDDLGAGMHAPGGGYAFSFEPCA